MMHVRVCAATQVDPHFDQDVASTAAEMFCSQRADLPTLTVHMLLGQGRRLNCM